MYLSSHQARLLAHVMATLAQPLTERQMRQRIAQPVMDLLGAQFCASFVWQPRAGRFDGCVQIGMDPDNLARYAAYYHDHDPITFRLQPHRRAVCVNEVMPQAALMRTEFFNDFLARDGLHWGINVYAWSGHDNIGDLRIWRDRRRAPFTREDARLLDLVRPAFTEALARCRGDGTAGAGDDAGNGTASAPPPISPAPGEGDAAAGSAAAAAAAMAVLSPRERAVARLIAQGLPDKAVAQQLGVSVTTVRTHVDHAFRKLGVHNRVQLVGLLQRAPG